MKVAIGTPIGLAISTDTCKGLGKAVQDVYPSVEHRECMRHLWKNFKKRYSGDLFNYNMWPVAKACTIEKLQILEMHDMIRQILEMHDMIKQMIISKFEARGKLLCQWRVA